MGSVAGTTRAWLYVRDDQSVRIELRNGSLAIYGPGDRFRRADFDDTVTAMLELSRLEQDLVSDRWSLEQMTTERRSGRDRRAGTRGGDRRRGNLKLVR